jgi:hypothetical protein
MRMRCLFFALQEKRLLTQAEAANSRALADKAQAEARSKGYDTELARIKQQIGASFPHRKRGRPAAGDDVQPGRILARGGKKRQKTGDEEVSDPNDPLVYRYIGTIVGNCLKGGVGDLDLYPIFGSGGSSSYSNALFETRCMHMSTWRYMLLNKEADAEALYTAQRHTCCCTLASISPRT